MTSSVQFVISASITVTHYETQTLVTLPSSLHGFKLHEQYFLVHVLDSFNVCDHTP